MDIKDSTWHAIQRTVSVIAILAIICLPIIFGYQMGYKKGVATCMSKTTYSITGPTTIASEKQVPQPWFLGIKIMKVGLGFVIERDTKLK